MGLFLKNLNWLSLFFILVALAIGVFYIPLPALAAHIGLLAGLAIIVFWGAAGSAKTPAGLRTEREYLSSIVDNLRDGVVAYDQNYKILVMNRAAEQILGLKASEVVGQLFTLKLREGGASSRFRILLTILFPALAEMIVRRSEPGTYPQIIDISFEEPPLELRVATNKIIDEKGNHTGFVKIINDRTRELTLLRSKSEFITVASHQLRTPLSGLNWALNSLKNEKISDSQKELVVQSIAAVNRLLKISEDLLNVAKIEEGKFGYNFEELDVAAFLENILAQSKPVASQYQVRLFLEQPKEALPKAIGDPRKLSLVIANILDNAVKYNIPNGEVVVKVEKLPGKPFIHVNIRDTGIGIPQEELKKTFTKFFRAANAMKVAVEGTGLGLYIAKNIIRRHGGEIWVESTPNRGSTFHFTLPTDSSLIPAKEYAYEEE